MVGFVHSGTILCNILMSSHITCKRFVLKKLFVLVEPIRKTFKHKPFTCNMTENKYVAYFFSSNSPQTNTTHFVSERTYSRWYANAALAKYTRCRYDAWPTTPSTLGRNMFVANRACIMR